MKWLKDKIKRKVKKAAISISIFLAARTSEIILEEVAYRNNSKILHIFKNCMSLISFLSMISIGI